MKSTTKWKLLLVTAKTRVKMHFPVLRPKDPYQDRPLPYVIGSEKWKLSSKIGLESSSSESEHMDEEDEESSSSSDNNEMEIPKPSSSCPRLSSSSSESNYYNLDSNSARDTNNGSLRAKSQDTLNADYEPMTPTSVLPKSQNTNMGPPNFAEELAKRLGSYLPSQKTVVTQEADNSSINNRPKDDLFAQEDNEDVFSNRSENLFSGGGGLFDDDPSTAKWNTTSYKPVNTNIIPPSMDGPPPISSTSTKPKSALDDLFGDADSEDSDDIFSTKSKKIVPKSETFLKNSEVLDKKYLTSGFTENIGNMATSTPETHDDVQNLFGDDELNENDLFSTSQPRNRLKSETPPDKGTRKKPIGGISVFGGVDISSKLPNKIFRQSSSDSSSSETASYSNTQSSATNSGTHNAVLNDNIPDSSSIVAASNDSHSNRDLGNSTNSSGISIQPSSINNTDGSSLGVDFQPQMTSTRLKSDDLYRERAISDSLYAPHSQLPDSTNSNSSRNLNQLLENRVEESSHYQDNIFDDEDDVFGPPPLPKGGAKSSKPKVISLFDDSESEDELFFSANSKSRSQKSVDCSPKPQFQDKDKAKSSKKISLFDDDDDDDDDIFGAKDSDTKPENSLVKTTSLFDDSDEEDLFGSSFSRKGTRESIFDNTDLPTESLKTTSSIMGITTSDFQETLEDSQNIFAASKGGLFDDDIDDDDLFGEKAPLSAKLEEDPIEIPTDDGDIIIEPKAEVKTPPKIPQKPDSLILSGSQVVIEKSDNVVDGACVSKRHPPKTLNIRSSPPLITEESSQVPRREMSGKIKDISRRLGGLKILSPTDTPPVLRKNEEKPEERTEEEEEFLAGDSEDGGSLSVPSSGKETSVSVDSLPRQDSAKSTSVTIDELLMNVETLTTASKDRVRIPVKRRPQSRRARQTALRQSGIDFDAPDSSKDPDPDPEDDEREKQTEPSSETTNDSNERLQVPTRRADKAENSRNTELSLSLATDTTNKNTLLSPSTDEEDLFDVPPELPEDPFREDSLFGRAPIIDDLTSAKDESEDTNMVKNTNNFAVELDKEEKNAIKSVEEEESEAKLAERVISSIKNENKEDEFCQSEIKDPLDPLHDSSSIDPSQLFAFVTKTPSPEKSTALLFQEDDSLFSSSSSLAKSALSAKRDIFDDPGEDLFSAPLLKSGRKPLNKNLSLFDDDRSDGDEDLFGARTKKVEKIEPERAKSSEQSSLSSQKGLFENESEDLFADGPRKSDVAANKMKNSDVRDIFGDESSGEEDLFGFKKTMGKKSGTLFNDGDDIFGKPSSSMAKARESRASIKKAVTRDLKKTAEQIVEDPLSTLRED
ncbi:WASH complex subunit 2C isoform X2 [Belonocnema kinseyi]|uniref:WASH complex subunit 2C isoform X2 n=1 Tax=Belonocnema kinseyi TaxID=2817044 RepID=UPI00143DAE27|nr:WASH complex subunit 2C isoform X2 [Belonocnema kinseyi]